MFSITDEEKAAVEAMAAKQTELQELNKQFRRFGYNMSEEDQAAKAGFEAEAERMKAEIAAMSETDPVLLYQIKTEANKLVASKVPGTPSMWLTLAEDLVSNLDTTNGERAKALVKGLALRLIRAMGDADILKARAEYTAARYSTMVEAGLPAELAGRILVAEAGRTINFPSAGGSKK